ncbi:MAG TPA: peptidase M14, partial [Bacillota bacterium]|nr:peptidase M14 [Bacillota bacterium]
ESLAMVNFTRKYDFQRVIAYHTQGQEIYYQFNRTIPVGALELARQFAKISGYAIAANPPDASYAGYKDWFIQEYQRPGFTIEVGQGVNPIPVSQLDTIYRQNEGILLAGAMPG